jgi:hypothetical protein
VGRAAERLLDLKKKGKRRSSEVEELLTFMNFKQAQRTRFTVTKQAQMEACGSKNQ